MPRFHALAALVACAVCSAGASAAAEGNADASTLPAALALGQESHPSLKATAELVSARRALASQPYSRLVPRLVFDVNGEQREDPLLGPFYSHFLPMARTGTQAAGVETGLEGESPFGTRYRLSLKSGAVVTSDYTSPLGPGYTTGVGLTVSQSLVRDLLPSVFFAPTDIALARTDEESARAKRVERQVFLEIAEVWLIALRAGAIEDLRKRSLGYAREFEKLTKELIAAGNLSALDLAVAQQTVAVRESELVAARIERERADGMLAAALALPDGASLSPLPRDAAVIDGWASVAISDEEAIARVVAEDPELAALAAERERLQLEQHVASQAHLPDISLVVTGEVGGLAGKSNCHGGYLSDGITPCFVPDVYQGDYGTAVANLALAPRYGVRAAITGSLPLASVGLDAEHEALSFELRALEHRVAARQRELSWNVRQRMAELRQRRGLLEAVQQNTALAQDVLDAEVKKLRAGRSTTLDLLRVQELLITSLSQLLEARVQYARSLAQMRGMLGELRPERAALFAHGAPSPRDAGGAGARNAP